MLDIAMALRLKGMASADGIAEATGATADEVTGVLETMVAAEHASETPMDRLVFVLAETE